jgi:hypothetical protein
MSNVFVKVGHGLEWFGKEVAHLVTDVPAALGKLITLSQDGEKVASDAGNEVITMATDVTALVAAVAKDDGASLQAIEALITSGGAAIGARGLNATEDAAVLAAVEAFFKSINGTNYADVLTAIAKVIADGKSLSKTVIGDVEKLINDAK